MTFDPDSIKIIANQRAELSNDILKFLREQFATFSKWLTASLLAVNTAAILTFGGMAAKGEIIASPMAFFGLGLALALISGLFLQDAYNFSQSFQFRLLKYWQKVGITGFRNFAFERRMKKKFKKAQKIYNYSPYLGWASAISFFIGITIYAVKL